MDQLGELHFLMNPCGGCGPEKEQKRPQESRLGGEGLRREPHFNRGVGSSEDPTYLNFPGDETFGLHLEIRPHLQQL